MQRNTLVNWANSLGFDASTIANDSKLEAHLKYLQNNATTVNGVLATGTLTSDTSAQADGDKVTIGSVTYTFRTALTGTKATGTITTTDVFSDGERIVIEGITYTMRTTLTNTSGAPYEVLIGVSAAVSLDNLKSAINASAGAGTTYGVGTAAHPKVTAEANAADSQVVQAKVSGTNPNSYLTTTTAAHATWGAGTLESGVATIPNEVLLGANPAAMLDNLKVAINGGATEGTNYSFGTRAHPQVTAEANADTTQVVQARDYAVTNASIATTDPTDTGNHMSWGAATLESGTRDQNAVNAAAVAQDGAGKNMNV